MQSDSPSSRIPALLSRLLPWAIGGGVLVCFLVLVLGSYTVKAHSDCHNWLIFARDFGREFTHSRWPWGFPLYLRGVLSLAGPYWVYLANLPVLLVLFAVASAASLLFRRDGALRVPALWAVLSTWIVVLSTDARSFVRYLNPYRDPLSYVLLLASVAVFVRSLAAAAPRRRGWGVVLSGVLLGLACSVREPSILMAGPMALYGILAWRAGRRRPAAPAPGAIPDRPFPFWTTVLAFAAGMAVALVPLLVQTYLTTHQMLVPPQASLESSVVPGAHLKAEVFRQVGGDAWAHFVCYEPVLLILAAAGLLVAAVRRDRFALAIVAPAAAVYFLFYSFYWTFVVRYFYVTLLLLALLAGHALATLVAALSRLPRHGRLVAWLLLAAAAAASGSKILAERARGPGHQVPEARAMATRWRAACPADTSVVYADRALCEWLDWFTPWPSAPLPAWPAPGETPPAALRQALEPRLARGETLVSANWGTPGNHGSFDLPYLRRTFDLLPFDSFDTTPYHAGNYVYGTVTLSRIAPWSTNRVSLDWPIPAAGPHGSAYWYMLDAGEWPPDADGTPASPATVTVDGTPLPRPIPHGGAWVDGAIPADGAPADAPRTVPAVIEAAHPLPRDMILATGSLDTPMPLDFRRRAPFDHLWRWSGDVIPSGSAGEYATVVTGTADFLLPVPHPALAGAVVEWEILSSDKAPGVRVPVSVWEGDRRLASAEIPADRLIVRLGMLLPRDPDRDVRTLRLVVEPQPHPLYPEAAPLCVEIYQAILHRTPADWSIRLDVAERGNEYLCLSGFHPAEGRGESAYRWTSGPAEIAVYLPDTPPPAGVPVNLRLLWSAENIPSEVPGAGTLRVSWAGTPLDGQIAPAPDAPGLLLWQAPVPPALLSADTAHRITLDAPVWRPSDYGSRDSRTLGVRLFRITLDSAP